ILAVADSYDAMVSPRPHRPALSRSQSEALLTEGAGRQWDPQVVEHFLAHRPAIEPARSAQAAPGFRGAIDAWELSTSRPQSGWPNGQAVGAAGRAGGEGNGAGLPGRGRRRGWERERGTFAQGAAGPSTRPAVFGARGVPPSA